MRISVIIMLAPLTTIMANVGLTATSSRAILLLDFRKAYDTVELEFLFLVSYTLDFLKNLTEII